MTIYANHARQNDQGIYSQQVLNYLCETQSGIPFSYAIDWSADVESRFFLSAGSSGKPGED